VLALVNCGITMAATALRRRAPEGEPRNLKAIESILRTAGRMNRLIGDLLDVTLIEAGQLGVERARVSARQLATECAEAQRPTVEVTLEQDVKPSPDRMEYQRAVLRYAGGKLLARTTGSQVSSRLLSMVGANALLVVQPSEAKVPAGETLPALLTGQVRT
jgi:signal transduction histidine kinase